MASVLRCAFPDTQLCHRLDCILALIASEKKTANGIPHDTAPRLCKGLSCCENIVAFIVTQVNIILFTDVGKLQVSHKSDNKLEVVFTPVSKVWISLR
jgi:hypothetical protein